MNSRLKIQLPFVKKDTGLGDIVKSLVDPNGVNTCQACERRRLALNAILSFSGTQSPVPQQPKPKPADWRQQYGAVDDESLPDGG